MQTVRTGLPARMAALTATILLLIVTSSPQAWASASNAGATNQAMFTFMNQERAARGLPPLQRSPALDGLAQSWADRMVQERAMYHPSTPLAVSSGHFSSGAQNLAYHDDTLSSNWAHNVWMNSGVHRKNILDPAFTHVGLAIACNPSGGSRPYVLVSVEFGGSGAPLTSTPSRNPIVAGGAGSAQAGCAGSSQAPALPADPAPAPTETQPASPPPAPTSPPPAPTSPVANSAEPAGDPASATGSGRLSPAPAPPPPAPPAGTATPAPEPEATAETELHPDPTPPETPAPARGDDPLGALGADGTPPEGRSPIALTILLAGLAGLVLMRRLNPRQKDRSPRHRAGR